MAKLFSTGFQNVISSAILSLILTFSFVSSQNVDKKICQTKECLLAGQNLKESMNVTVDPCENFYLYSCGNYPTYHNTSNDIPQSWFIARLYENNKEISDFIKQNNSNDEPEAVHKARKLYSLCMNEASFSNETAPVENILQKIGLPVRAFLSNEVKDFDFASVLARAARFAGVKPYFDLGVTPNPFNRKVNVIGLSRPSESDSLSLSLTRNHRRSKRAITLGGNVLMSAVTKKMCGGDPESIICKEWNSPSNSSIRDWNFTRIRIQNSDANLALATSPSTLNTTGNTVIYSLKKLQDWTDSIATELNTTIPKLNWTRYIEETFAGLDNVTLDLSDPNKVEIAIEYVDFVRNMTKFIYSIETVKNLELGLWWAVVSTLLPYADSEIFHLKWGISSSLENDTRRDAVCIEKTIESFGMAISYGYTTKERYVKAKTEVRRMFEHLRDSFSQILKNLSWMDETTRQKAQKKLYSLGSLIAYPSAIKTTSRLNDIYKDADVTDNFFDTMVSKIQKQIDKSLNKLNQVNDLLEDDYAITPNLMNAFYVPSKNAIVIPAGILGEQFYTGSLGAVDYGKIGSIVGHEMTHGFDNQGRHHNHVGDIEEWWEPNTTITYREKASCFVKAYGNYTITQNGITQKGNSKETLGEDISDNGGFKEALFGYRKCVWVNGEEPLLPQFENYTHEQILTLSFANLWCENPTWISPIINKIDPHSPNGVRVNGVLQNSKEFAEIWKCPKGSKMNPSDDKCSVW